MNNDFLSRLLRAKEEAVNELKQVRLELEECNKVILELKAKEAAWLKMISATHILITFEQEKAKDYNRKEED